MSKQALLVIAMIVAAAALSALRNAGFASPDLLATWMAGLNFARGSSDQIYAPARTVFDMHPPESWVKELSGQGYTDAIFPFIYPPLWAWIGAGLTRITDYPTLVFVANIVNPLLLGGMLWLAARITGGRMPPVAYVGTGFLMFSLSVISLVALEQNQPQILVAFLTVLAIERAQHGAPKSAGAALALAASIKLYPALFVLFWLVRGDRRPALAFAVTGTGLAGLSLAVAGWPLHAQFLDQMRLISGTALLTFFTYCADSLAAKLFFKDAMTFVPFANGASDGGWLVMAKPPLWRLLDATALLAVLAGLAWLARRRDDPLFWPVAIIAIALVSPLSWGYHYLTALAFLPALLDRLGAGRGILAALAILLPVSPLYMLSDLPVFEFRYWAAIAGSLAMAGYGALLIALVLGAVTEPRRALRSDPAPL